LVFAGFVAILLWRRFDWDATFPQGTLSRRTADEHSTTAALSPKPATPSIPGHSVGRPRTIPGLEEFEGYAPTLDAGLTQIVFAVASGAESHGDFDLYLATRKNPSDSFQRPRRLDECSSSDRETDPTLSPDGLELIFVRAETSGGATLMRSMRSSLSESFSEPETLSIPNLPSGPGVEYDSPQLLHDGGDLIVRVTERRSGDANPTYFMAPRYSLEEPFGNAAPLPVFVEKERHFLTGDGLRAFVARRYTIQLCCRPTLDAPFSAPGRIGALEATFTGMAEGPIWVSPAEDFLFYCVTTVNESHQQRRSLRQVRFR
jgi:hypothetical protein